MKWFCKRSCGLKVFFLWVSPIVVSLVPRVVLLYGVVTFYLQVCGCCRYVAIVIAVMIDNEYEWHGWTCHDCWHMRTYSCFYYIIVLFFHCVIQLVVMINYSYSMLSWLNLLDMLVRSVPIFLQWYQSRSCIVFIWIFAHRWFALWIGSIFLMLKHILGRMR